MRTSNGRRAGTPPTTAGRRTRWLAAILTVGLAVTPGCRRPPPPQAEQEPQTESRTEFTERIENFFEYEPLVPGKPSRFLIHLTDLNDGAPVETAEVTLTVRTTGAGAAGRDTKAKAGKVTGIYVAEVQVPAPGSYDIEFRVRNRQMDERMMLTGFTSP